MSQNMQHMQNASRMIGELIRLVELYESNSVPIGPNFAVVLTGPQILQLKQAFSALRTELIIEVNAVTAS